MADSFARHTVLVLNIIQHYQLRFLLSNAYAYSLYAHLFRLLAAISLGLTLNELFPSSYIAHIDNSCYMIQLDVYKQLYNYISTH